MNEGEIVEIANSDEIYPPAQDALHAAAAGVDPQGLAIGRRAGEREQLIAAPAVGSTDPAPGGLPEALARAIALHRAGRLAEAARVCDEVVATWPNHAEALHLRGLVAAQQRCYEDAERWLSRALASNPRSADANANRASVRNALGRFAEALTDAERALGTDPRHPAAHYQRGLALQSLRRLDEAIASYQRALEIRPDLVQALVNGGAAQQDLGRPTDALVSLDRALAIDPRNVEANHNRGLALQRLRRFAEGLASLCGGACHQARFPRSIEQSRPLLAGPVSFARSGRILRPRARAQARFLRGAVQSSDRSVHDGAP